MQISSLLSFLSRSLQFAHNHRTWQHGRICNVVSRVKTIQERLDCLNKFVYFEIGAFFHALCRRVKKRANFKTNKFLQAIQSFLYCLNSKLIISSHLLLYQLTTVLPDLLLIIAKKAQCVGTGG